MNTPSHFLLTAAAGRAGMYRHFRPASLLWGSVMPDMPLFLLSVISVLTLPLARDMTIAESFDYMYGVLFFENIFWMIAHNFFHSPTNLLLLFLLTLIVKQFAKRVAQQDQINSVIVWLWGFLLSCGVHSVIDILTHYDDGPLLFMPFNFSLRFHSPVSYWDPAHGGRIFFLVELVLDLVLIIVLLSPHIMRFIRRKRQDNKQ